MGTLDKGHMCSAVNCFEAHLTPHEQHSPIFFISYQIAISNDTAPYFRKQKHHSPARGCHMVAIIYTLKQFKTDLMMFFCFSLHMNSKQSKSQGYKDLKKTYE